MLDARREYQESGIGNRELRNENGEKVYCFRSAIKAGPCVQQQAGLKVY